MSADITVVKASHVQPFIHYLDEVGAPVDKVFEQVNLSRAQFSHPDNLIPEAPFWKFLGLVDNKPETSGIGFKVTDKLSLDRYGLFGAKVIESKTLHLALNTFIEIMGEQSNCPPFWLKEDDKGVWFCRLGTQGINYGQWPVEQHVVSLMIQLVRAYTSETWSPCKVELQTHSLVGIEHTNSLANTAIAIKQSVTAVFISQEILRNTPAAPSNQASSKQYSQQENSRQEQIPQKCSRLVSKVLKHRDDLKPFQTNKIASDLGISVRQLQRLLKKDSTTFRDLCEQVLFEQAKYLLKQNDTSILEVSLELGYLESANFTRAFKRWAGVSPSEYKLQA